MSFVVSLTETEAIKELLYNLYGYNSRLFRKLDDEQTRFEGKILDDLSKISYRLLHSNPLRSQRNTQVNNNNDDLLADCILPKVFVSTIESNHFQLLSCSSFSSSCAVIPAVLQPVPTTSALLSSVLKYFYRLSTNLAIIRMWCRSSSISSERDPSSAETFENQALGGDSYDLSSVKNSVNKILLSIEQELSLTELQIRGQSSYFETQLSSSFLSKLSATTGTISSSSSSSTKITLLRFYQQCMKYERLLQSLLGMILNFHDNYDLYASAATATTITSASSTSPSSSYVTIIDATMTSSMEEERAKKQHRLSLIKLQQSFNQISFLYQSEIILKKGEKLEHYNIINHHLSPVPSASRSSTSDASSTMIFYRKHQNSDSSPSSSSLSYLSSLNYFYLFIKQLSVSYVEYLTRQIMQSLWNKGGKGNSVLSVNVPLISRNGDSSSVNNLLRMMNSQGIPG
jgi:hypothetical protein